MWLGLGLGLRSRSRRLGASGASSFSPLTLFANSEQGAWYDPSDFSTLFQDSAGTIPVTAVEQPVGRMLDKSGRGNHATQAVAASRTTLRALVNMLLDTENFGSASWTKTAVTSVTSTPGASPTGAGDADLVLFAAGGRIGQLRTFIAGSVVRAQIQVKKSNRDYQILAVSGAATSGSNMGYAVFNLQTMTLANSGVAGAGFTLVGTPIIEASTNGYARLSIDVLVAGTSASLYTSAVATDIATTASAGSSVYLWGADLRAANNGIGLPAYQRVTTSSDYYTAGFPLYLSSDGVDDGMATASIDFTGTDKMTVWAGLRKQSDSARSMPLELSASTASNNGAFFISAPDSAAANYNFASKGTAQVDNVVSPYAAPVTGLITGIANIAGPSNVLRVNGAQVASVTSSQGAGNYGNYPLFLFRRGGSSLPFNGRCYGLIVRGAASTQAEIEATEAWLNGKTRAYA